MAMDYGKITAMMDKTEPPLFSSRQLRPGALRQNCGKSFLLNYFHLLSVISQLSACLNRKKVIDLIKLSDTGPEALFRWTLLLKDEVITTRKSKG